MIANTTRNGGTCSISLTVTPPGNYTFISPAGVNHRQHWKSASRKPYDDGERRRQPHPDGIDHGAGQSQQPRYQPIPIPSTCDLNNAV
ncbi:MAG: hypothetical protein IPK76_17595 [Lewinellaceae bacterium]|nr:hypothetical protein [Lewinellaceae bacterium]